MRVKDILTFFQDLDRRIEIPIRVLLTGGAAAILQGVTRATHDIDFELALKKPAEGWEGVERALKETARATGIAPQYAEDIDRWSSIVLPAKTSRLYTKIGKVEVRILSPGLWAIGKLARYLPSDVNDMVTVLKNAKTDPRTLARLWGRALGLSPSSNALSAFHCQVESFFDTHTAGIWGPENNLNELKSIFTRTAQTTRRKGNASGPRGRKAS